VTKRERERLGVGSETASPNIKARKESDAEVEIVNSLNQAASSLEGVEFTYEKFADALSKYDFSFEIGDMVSTPDMLCTYVEFLLIAYIVCFCLLLFGYSSE
jgi:hypothetical protein